MIPSAHVAELETYVAAERERGEEVSIACPDVSWPDREPYSAPLNHVPASVTMIPPRVHVQSSHISLTRLVLRAAGVLQQTGVYAATSGQRY